MSKHPYPAEWGSDDGHAGRGSARGLSFVMLTALAFVAFCLIARAVMAHDYNDFPGWNRSAAPLEHGDEERARYLLIWRVTNSCDDSGITLTDMPGARVVDRDCPPTLLHSEVFETLADVFERLNYSAVYGEAQTYFTKHSFKVFRLDDLTPVELRLDERVIPEKREVVTRERHTSEWVKP